MASSYEHKARLQLGNNEVNVNFAEMNKYFCKSRIDFVYRIKKEFNPSHTTRGWIQTIMNLIRGKITMARDVLLDYVLKTSVVEPILPASSAYLHNVLCIVGLKNGATAGIYECSTKAQVQTYTDSDCWQLLEAGLSKIYVCAVSAYSAVQALVDATEYKFFTILTDPSFTTAPTALTGFSGVAGWSTDDATKAENYAKISTANNTAFIDPSANKGDNMYWAFGKLLSGALWKNQQFIGMPADGITTLLGTAETYFTKRLSFVLKSEEFGNRLAFL